MISLSGCLLGRYTCTLSHYTLNSFRTANLDLIGEKSISNIIERRLIKNSKGLKVPDCNTEQSKHSFFVETIVHWNQLADKVVCADSVEAFKTALQEQDQAETVSSFF
jgi:hypothetical protein